MKIKNAIKHINGKTIGILGLAFKPNTDDMRNAPSIDIIEAIKKGEGQVRVHDPHAMPKASQIEGLKKLLKEGLTADMVLMELPSVGNRPAEKMTTISMLLSVEALLRFLLDEGVAKVDEVTAAINLNISKCDLERKRLEELKKRLQKKE